MTATALPYKETFRDRLYLWAVRRGLAAGCDHKFRWWTVLTTRWKGVPGYLEQSFISRLRLRFTTRTLTPSTRWHFWNFVIHRIQPKSGYFADVFKWEVLLDGAVVGSFYGTEETPQTPWHLPYMNSDEHSPGSLLTLQKAK